VEDPVRAQPLDQGVHTGPLKQIDVMAADGGRKLGLRRGPRVPGRAMDQVMLLEQKLAEMTPREAVDTGDQYDPPPGRQPFCDSTTFRR